MTAAFPDPHAGGTPMPPPTKPRPLRRLGVWIRNVLVVVGLFCSIVVVALWVAAAHLNDYRADVESAVSDMLGHPITIGAVEASWEGLAPVLRLRDVALHGAGAGSAGAPIRLDSAEIALDPVASARTRTLRSRHIRVVGAALTLTRNAQGKIAIAGFGQHAGTQGRSLSGAKPAGWQAIALAQRNLELLRTEVRWLDLAPRSVPGGPPQETVAPVTLGEVNARIRNTADRHHLRAWISPGEKDGRSLVVRADVTGSLATPGWSAKLAIDAEGLDLGAASRLARHIKPGGTELVAALQGTADLDLVLDLRPEGLQRLDGTISVLRPGIRFERPGTTDTLGSTQYLTLERIDLDGVLSRDATGWLAKTRQLKLVSRDGIWPTERASVRVVSEQDRARRFEIRADRVRLEHVRTLLDAVLTRPALKRGLETASPTGEFRDFTVTAALLDGVIRMRGVEGEVVGLDTRGDQMIPGVKGVHGRVEATAEGGRFTLSRGPREFTLPSFYRGARKVASATGTVEWTLGTEGGAAWSDDLVIRSEGVEATLNGAGLWRTDTASPFVTTTVTLDEGTVGAVSRLLLIKKLPGAFHTWFKGAVKGGTVKRLTIATQGYVHTLPFDAGPSGFTLSADIRGVEFAYAPGWPQASDVSARIRVRGRRFDARVISAKLFGASSKRFAMVIPNLTARPLRLDINGTVSGDAADALRFVRESVLDSSLGDQLSELAATGPCEIALNMALEVPVGRPKRLAGTVKLNENRVTTGIGPVLENASGTLEFDLDGLRLRKATALYLDTPVMLSTQPALDDGATVIAMQGTADRAFLKRLSAAPDPLALEKHSLLDRIVKGRSKWQASLQLPGRERNAPRMLRITTPLTGMALDLPGALGKRASETRPLEIALVFGKGDSRELKIRYGSNWNGAFSLAREDETWAVERGHLRIGGEVASLPPQAGILIDGRLQSFHFDSWSRVLLDPDTPIGDTGAWADRIRDIEVELGSVRAFDQDFAVERIRATRSEAGWNVRIFGPQVAGRLRLPNASAAPESPLVLRFDHLKLKRGSGDTPYRGRRPSEFPPIDARVASMEIDDLSLGDVRFLTKPGPAAMQITDLRVATGAFTAQGNGVWAYENDRHTTEFNLRLHADSLGRLFQALGNDDAAIEGGTTDIVVDAIWEGVPSSFDFGILNGSIHARSKKGQLLDIQPGLTGRAFGLLSLAALPRHLRMDFSHVFGEGFSFDTIEGSFHLEGGNAYTNNLHMVGPSARVDLAGRTGLLSRDYDQLVTVTPRITSSIPLAPLWLAEKMLQTNIFNRVFSSRYTLTGSWDDPVVTPIVVPNEEVQN